VEIPSGLLVASWNEDGDEPEFSLRKYARTGGAGTAINFSASTNIALTGNTAGKIQFMKVLADGRIFIDAGYDSQFGLNLVTLSGSNGTLASLTGATPDIYHANGASRVMSVVENTDSYTCRYLVNTRAFMNRLTNLMANTPVCLNENGQIYVPTN